MHLVFSEQTPDFVFTPDIFHLERFLSVPAIYSPNMSEDNWEKELDAMLARTLLTRALVTNQISFEDYLDGLADTGTMVYDVVDYWNEGISLSRHFQHTGLW